MIDTINIGGDTDTYASIVGNMIGALLGKFYPEDYILGVKGHKELGDNVRDFLRQ